jgi:16S rRNA (cytidine1402-2'-O)-methyltransferase
MNHAPTGGDERSLMSAESPCKPSRSACAPSAGEGSGAADAPQASEEEGRGADAAQPGGRAPAALVPGLYIVATPIGNLGDITLRARDALAAARVVLCEDTRVTGKLLKAYGLRTPMLSYHEHNAEARRPEILARLDRGEAVALVSDAGTPLISDPGYKLVRAVQEAGHPVTPLPGASAALTALMAAGLPTDRFLFQGFLPNKRKARRDVLAELTATPATLVFYESPQRLGASLADMAAVLGDREAAVARELTKRFEEIRRERLSVLAAHYDTPPKGEVVVVVAPPPATPDAPPDDADLDARLRAALATHSLRDAVAQVTEATGCPRKRVYQRALAVKDTPS